MTPSLARAASSTALHPVVSLACTSARPVASISSTSAGCWRATASMRGVRPLAASRAFTSSPGSDSSRRSCLRLAVWTCRQGRAGGSAGDEQMYATSYTQCSVTP